MSKLAEMTGWELMGALAEIAEPVGNLVNDDAFWDCFVDCTRRGVGLKQKDGLRFLLRTYAKLIPIVCGGHKNDTARILAVIEGKPVAEVMQMNGEQLYEDFKVAYKEHLEPFFIKSALLVNRGSSSR